MVLVVKNPSANAGDTGDVGFDLWVKEIPWRRKWQTTPVFLPEESHGQRSLVGYSARGRKESDTTEANRVPILHFPYPMKHSTYICLYVFASSR